jgi:fructose-bisphosphate aldolase class II
LARIRNELDIPLVLHGGSGLTDQDFTNAINNGINKINFYTGNSLLAVEAVKNHLEKEKGITSLPELTNAAHKEIKNNVEKYIGLFANNNL